MSPKEFISWFTLENIVNGNWKLSLDGFFEKWKKGEAILLDVRTKEEKELVPLDAFGIHIPLNELPERLSEIPKDKIVCTVCPQQIRATIAFSYLTMEGFSNVKILEASPAKIVEGIRPGFVYKMRK